MTVKPFTLPEWIPHDGCGCPLPIGTLVTHRHKSGRVCEEVISADDHKLGVWKQGRFQTASAWAWAVNGRPAWGEPTDIDAYKITGLPAGEVITIKEAEPV